MDIYSQMIYTPHSFERSRNSLKKIQKEKEIGGGGRQKWKNTK